MLLTAKHLGLPSLDRCALPFLDMFLLTTIGVGDGIMIPVPFSGVLWHSMLVTVQVWLINQSTCALPVQDLAPARGYMRVECVAKSLSCAYACRLPTMQ